MSLKADFWALSRSVSISNIKFLCQTEIELCFMSYWDAPKEAILRNNGILAFDLFTLYSYVTPDM